MTTTDDDMMIMSKIPNSNAICTTLMMFTDGNDADDNNNEVDDDDDVELRWEIPLFCCCFQLIEQKGANAAEAITTDSDYVMRPRGVVTTAARIGVGHAVLCTAAAISSRERSDRTDSTSVAPGSQPPPTCKVILRLICSPSTTGLEPRMSWSLA